MAVNRLETKIQLRYGTYSEWMNSDVILLQGEAAICSFPQDRVIDSLSNSRPEHTPPAIGIKIGDGHSYFYQLPWVQGIAADVYSWAKSSIKPTYTAQEIQGLQSFVENLVGGDVEVNISPRIYQLIQGTGDNINKYYLRYKENNEESDWIIDTSTFIDLENLEKIVNWIGTDLDEYADLPTRTGTQTRLYIGQLNHQEEPVTNQFVTSVTENAGIISTTKAQPSFSNISGTAQVEQGGTGRQVLTEDAVLVGNGTNQVKLIPIAETIANNNHLVPNNLIKAYVDNAVAGLTGAMHFIGEARVVINNNSSIDPQIQDYNFSQAQAGDVILYNAKEFVWTGSTWHLLGDESSYAIKGSIKDADIAIDAEISQEKIANLDTTFNTKVDKVEGKILTSNDFTDELKTKLENLSEDAQSNIIEHILLNGIEIAPNTIEQLNKAVNIEINEFDAASQTKLQNIESGAEVNKIEKIVYGTDELVPDENRIVTITPDPHTEHENKIEQIFINGVEWVPNQNKQVRISIDQAALNLNVLEGATVPNSQGTRDEVTQVQKKLELERIAVSGDVKDLKQTTDTYIILNCGSSTEVI